LYDSFRIVVDAGSAQGYDTILVVIWEFKQVSRCVIKEFVGKRRFVLGLVQADRLGFRLGFECVDWSIIKANPTRNPVDGFPPS
jgi:hypothetical protein